MMKPEIYHINNPQAFLRAENDTTCGVF